MNLPTVVLPKRLDGPARVREIEMRFTVSRAIITNAMSEANPRGSSDYESFYNSPLVTAEGASLVDIPLTINDGDKTVQPLPRRSWLPSKGFDAPDVMHVKVDQVRAACTTPHDTVTFFLCGSVRSARAIKSIALWSSLSQTDCSLLCVRCCAGPCVPRLQIWGDVIDANGNKRSLMHRVGLTVFIMDSAANAKRHLQSAEAKQLSMIEAQFGPANGDNQNPSEGTMPIFASACVALL